VAAGPERATLVRLGATAIQVSNLVDETAWGPVSRVLGPESLRCSVPGEGADPDRCRRKQRDRPLATSTALPEAA
jgi:hypothetical protein